MFVPELLRSRFVVGIIVGAAVALTLAGFTAKAFLVPNPTPDNNPLLTEGFNFTPLRSTENVWRGPEIGEKIDLTRLKMKDGRTLASTIGKQASVLVLVNPDCAMCRTASDGMQYLREKLATLDTTYFVVSFAKPPAHIDFFEYAESLGVGAPSFLWDVADGPPPPSLFGMSVPSHLLVNSDGIALCVWPGSSEEKSVRDRMAYQIVADTLVATNALNAVFQKPTPPVEAGARGRSSN